jgi:ribosome-binding factor A
MAQGHRPDRVGDLIRKELSEMLTRGAVHDPGIGFITLTRVDMSPDLQLARVYYTSLGDAKARQETAKALERATPFLRRQVGARVSLRRVPELTFRFDQSVTHQDRIEQILRDLQAGKATPEVGNETTDGSASLATASSGPASPGGDTLEGTSDSSRMSGLSERSQSPDDPDHR